MNRHDAKIMLSEPLYDLLIRMLKHESMLNAKQPINPTTLKLRNVDPCS